MLKSIIKPEILAPAGSWENLTAALNTGADAVYLGLDRFSARKNAENFKINELESVSRLCHVSGVKIYLALNTLIFNEEIDELKEYITPVLKNNIIDAVIIQDLGVLSLIREIAPDVVIHGSTQMTITSVHGARILKKMGFKRVVLARELSLNEIKTINESVDIETEVFIHGALCVSVSGQCYMSALLGGRSGNRGLCAQPCRLDFNCSGKNNILSLKDLSLIRNINDLKKIGVTSIKIEGRMKRPEYTAAAVTACYNARNNNLNEDDIKNLKSVFSRSGFTNGYFTGRMSDMAGIRTKDDVTSADIELLKELKKLFSNPFKRYTLDITIIIKKDTVIKCIGNCEKGQVKLYFAPAEKAESIPINADQVVSQLSRFGGTIYNTGNIICFIDDGLWLSIARINQFRREIIEKMNNIL